LTFPTLLRGAVPGIGVMLLGMLLFAANDTLARWLIGTYAVGQLFLMRSLSGLCVMAPSIRRAGLRAVRLAPRPGLQLWRGVLSTFEAALFFYALTELPVAEVIAYYLAAPIYVTAMSPWLLGERVGWRRWSAVAIGFVGVLLALHPSPAGLSPAALCALVGSIAYAGFLIATRKLAGTDGSILMAVQLLGALLFGATLVALQGWTPPGLRDFVLMLVLGVGSLAGNLCVNRALRLAPASVVVPFSYTMIVWGLLFGWLFLGELPDTLALVGAAIIVGAGLVIFLREQALRRSRAA
jgi:S-adenosylmethionine uptake transporter